MTDDVLINKAATIERCVARAREEYAANPAGFATDFTRHDAGIVNIQRACEAALDMGQHLIRRESLGIGAQMALRLAAGRELPDFDAYRKPLGPNLPPNSC